MGRNMPTLLMTVKIIGVILIALGLGYMIVHKNRDAKLKNIDEYWGLLGDPVKVEQKFRDLLPQAECLKNKSIYLQLLSQIALAQALQKQFDAAHKTLDVAEALLTPDYDLAHVRILLERGRVFHQAGNLVEALIFFKKAFEHGLRCACDKYTIDAAHMIAIVVEKAEEKIAWNQRAIDMAKKNQQAGAWLGSLYHNLGQNYFDAQQPEKALEAFEKALEYRKQEGYIPNIRTARWARARALRALGRLDEAISIHCELIREYDAIAQSGNYDMPREMFDVTRGLVEEEIKIIERIRAK